MGSKLTNNQEAIPQKSQRKLWNKDSPIPIFKEYSSSQLANSPTLNENSNDGNFFLFL